MKVKRKIIKIDEELCDGCGNCVTGCAEGALEVIDGKARVVADRFCDGLGACIGECPTGALEIIEREADEFDEAAVEEYLASRGTSDPVPDSGAPASGCPSSRLQTFAQPGTAHTLGDLRPQTGDSASALSHWPIKIRLVPPHAPFLKQADLLVLADCGAAALPSLHAEAMAGKVVLMGCPKFDEVGDYIEKFSQIFAQAGIRSVTALVMEVPCCSGLPVIIQKGMQKAGKQVPMEKVVVSTRGNIIDRKKVTV
mgnify:FL=1